MRCAVFRGSRRRGRGRLRLPLFFAVAVPVTAAEITRAASANRGEIGLDVALLHGFPGLARLVLIAAELTGDRVVDVVPGRALVFEVALTRLVRVGPDRADGVLDPREVDDVARHGPVHLAPA